MRGQVWQEYILILAGLFLLAVAALAYLYKPSVDATICATAYMRAQAEIARQEFNSLRDYSIYRFECNFDSSLPQPETNIMCKCADPDRVGGAVKDVFSAFGITPNITVNQVT